MKTKVIKTTVPDRLKVLIVGMDHVLTEIEKLKYDVVIVATENCPMLDVEITNFKSSVVVSHD